MTVRPDSVNKRRMKRFTDFDSESGGSSEEFGSESPKSVWKTTVHHQVLKIREEDSHLGEDIGEKLAFLKSNLDAFLRENHGFMWRPASPLSGKSAIKSFN